MDEIIGRNVSFSDLGKHEILKKLRKNRHINNETRQRQ